MKSLSLTARRARFVGLNLIAVGLLYVVVADPLVDVVAEQSQRLTAAHEKLSRFQAIAMREETARQNALAAKDASISNVFLPGSTDGAINAELQARLKRIAGNPTIRVQSVRALEPQLEDGLRFFGAHLELVGPIAAIYDTLRTIDGELPFLFVRSAELRLPATPPGAAVQTEPTITATFDVYGASQSHALAR